MCKRKLQSRTDGWKANLCSPRNVPEIFEQTRDLAQPLFILFLNKEIVFEMFYILFMFLRRA